MSRALSGGADDDGSATILRDPVRVRTLEHTGLGADADPEMEFYAAWTCRALEVPAAVVSLVLADHQVLPGAAGLREPWATKRILAPDQSFCRRVVTDGRPLVIADARQDPRLRNGPAVVDVGIVAYAGMPLTDEAGHVLGVLGALDDAPRAWTAEQLATLRDVARACSTDLRLRLARYDAGQEGDRRNEFEEAQRRAYDRSQTLLLASQAFTDTRTVQDVRVRIGELVSTPRRPTYVGVVLLDERGWLRRVDEDPGVDAAGVVTPTAQTFPVTASYPSARAVHEGRIVHHLDRDSFDRHYPRQTRVAARELGLHTVVALPLPGASEPIGAVVLGWPAPRAVEPADLLTIATIAGYAGQALDRARLLDHRISVAQELQSAMLTTLPAVEGLAMAARYAAADARENVGGDWFDAAPTVDPARPDEQTLLVSVGDVIGHTLHAATIMGQLRSMLRQSAWDHPGGPPSLVLHAVETAGLGLELDAAGSAVLVELSRSPAGRWSMRWTNAGHPPPILLLPDGTSELLSEHDPLFGFALPVAPGSTLFLYTDGLVERRDQDIDTGIEALLAVLDEAREQPPEEIVDVVMGRLGADSADDVVAFAIRFPGP